MRHLTNRDKAVAEARAAINEAVSQRNAAATGRAYKALKEAEAMEAVYVCFGCGGEFVQGNELIICAVGMLRKRTDDSGHTTTEWLFEGDASNTRSLAICSDCDNGIDEYINLR